MYDTKDTIDSISSFKPPGFIQNPWYYSGKPKLSTPDRKGIIRELQKSLKKNMGYWVVGGKFHGMINSEVLTSSLLSQVFVTILGTFKPSQFPTTSYKAVYSRIIATPPKLT